MPLSNRKGKVTFTVLVAGILFIVGLGHSLYTVSISFGGHEAKVFLQLFPGNLPFGIP